jgi:hypothetical protein
MPSFHNGAVEIAYLDEGEGDPILLVHGKTAAASSRSTIAAMAIPPSSMSPRSMKSPSWPAMSPR